MSRRNKRGVLVKAPNDQQGVYYPDQEQINGKYPVTMLDDKLKPIMKDGQTYKKLFKSEDLKPFGFIN